MSLFRWSAIGLVIAAFTGQQQPARDVSMPPTSGTSVLGGTVLTDDAVPQPIRRALLTLNGGGLRTGKMTVSDDQGRFVFRDLPAGSFNLTGNKPGYIQTYYGARRPWRSPGQQIRIEPGQQRLDLVFRLVRGAVVSGVVVDPMGQPQTGLRVMALENRLVNGEPTWTMVSTGPIMPTDDRGAYRMYGLPPGTYIIGVAGTPLSTAARLTNDAEVQWAIQQAKSSATATTSLPGIPSPPPEEGPIVGYAPLYFPGTVDPAAATMISLAPGEDRSGVDFAMQFVPTARVSGVVMGPDGQPVPNTQISLMPQGRAAVSQFEGGNRAGTDPNGRFSFQSVRPGSYILSARGQSRAPGQMTMSTGPGNMIVNTGPSAYDLWAQTHVNVSGRDLPNVSLTLQTGMTLSGRLLFEGTKSAPADFSSFGVNLRPAPNQVSMGTNPTGSFAENGTFIITGVAPGRWMISTAFRPGPSTAGAMAGWTVKSILVRGVDVLDVPFEIQPNENPNDVVITYSNRTTDLSGTLIDGTGKPVAGYFVLLFPTDKSHWFAGSRRLRSPVRTLPDGRYRVAGLPAGEYFMAALTEFDSSDLYDTAFLEQVAAVAYKITLQDGEQKTLDLRTGGIP